MAVPTDTVAPTETTLPDYKLGDVNKDGNVDASDALLVLKHAAKLELIEDEILLKAADVQADDIIDANDALTILKIAAKLN